MTTGSADLPASTRLALERTSLAYERTLMAWTHTATSHISFGFTIYKFFQYLREGRPAVDAGLLGPRRFAILMIGIGLTALVFATVEHRHSMQALRAELGPGAVEIDTMKPALVYEVPRSP